MAVVLIVALALIGGGLCVDYTKLHSADLLEMVLIWIFIGIPDFNILSTYFSFRKYIFQLKKKVQNYYK